MDGARKSNPALQQTCSQSSRFRVVRVFGQYGWLISPGGVGRRAWLCAPAGCAGRRSSAWVCHRVVPGECDFLPGGIRSQPAGVGSSSRRQRSGGIGVASSQSGESLKNPYGSILYVISAEVFGSTRTGFRATSNKILHELPSEPAQALGDGTASRG